MSVIKISNLNAVLANSIIRNGMGFNVLGRVGFLGIYQGDIPRITDMIDNVDTFRKSDQLWGSTMPRNVALPLVYQTGESPFIDPTAEGKAAWFLYAGIETETKNVHAALIGTVSDSTGAGDLILSNVDFKTGVRYRAYQLKIAFPYSFTY